MKFNAQNVTTALGYRVVTDPNMVVPGSYSVVHRSWRERLFSRPWQPFKRTRGVTHFIPDPNVIIRKDTMIMHPDILRRLIDQLEEHFSRGTAYG